MTAANPLDYPWWLAARAAGIVAYLLLSASVLLGLTMAARVAPVAARPALRAAHERVALLALGSIAAHGLLLLGDPWLKASPLSLLVPFTLNYRPVWTGIGVCAAFLSAGLALSWYARRRIGARRWRNAHRLIPIAWALAAVHVLGAGSDAGSLWLRIPIGLTVVAAGTLLGLRWARRPGARARPVARARAERASTGGMA